MKPIHGAPVPQNIPSDCQLHPPIPCEFTVGDVVTFTNDYGVTFAGKKVVGFSPAPEHGRFVYLSKDSWWFPVSPSALTLERRSSQ